MDENNIVKAGGAITALVLALIFIVKAYRADVKELISQFRVDTATAAEKSARYLSDEMAKRDVVLAKMSEAIDKLGERVNRLDATAAGRIFTHGGGNE